MTTENRGIMYARAEAAPSAPNEILASLNSAFTEFKSTHAEQIKGVNARFDDVVTRDKLDKVNASVGDLQAALDSAVARMAAIEMGGSVGGGRSKDPDYSKAFAAHMRRGDVQASLNKGVAGEGGYLAPTEWDRTITDRLVLISPMRSICSVQAISTNGYSKLFNNRGTASGWVGETAARTATTAPTFGTMTYTTGEIYANVEATQQLLDDAEIDLEGFIASNVETEFAYQEGVAFVDGNGTAKPFGILTYVTGAAQAAAHPWGAILVTNSGAAAALTSAGIVNLVHALPSQYTANARFVMNRSTEKAVRLLVDGQGNYLWQPSYQAGSPASLAGYPLTEVAAMPNVGAGLKAVLFGDFKQAYQIVDRVGMRILRDPFTNKPYVSFYCTKRVGGALLNPDAMKVQNISV